MLSPDLFDKPIDPALHLLRALPTGVLLGRRTPVRPDPPVGFDLLDILRHEPFVFAIVPFGDLGGRGKRDIGLGLGVVMEELRSGG